MLDINSKYSLNVTKSWSSNRKVLNSLFIFTYSHVRFELEHKAGLHRPQPQTWSVRRIFQKFLWYLKNFFRRNRIPNFRYLDTCWSKYFSNIYFGFSNIFLFIGPLQKNKHAGVFEWSSDWPWSPLTQMELRKLSLERTIYLFDGLPLYTFGTSSLDELLLFIIRLTNW